MKKKKPITPILSSAFWKKPVAASMALALFCQSSFAHNFEKNLWDERRHTLQAKRNDGLKESGKDSSPHTWLASLGQSFPVPRTLEPIPSQPRPDKNDGSSAQKSTSLARLTSDLSINGIVRRIQRPPTAGDKGSHAPIVVLIQDVHGHREAQTNIASMILKLLSSNPKLLIGVEGASGKISTQPFRSRSQTINQEIGSFFLSAGYIGGPEYAGFAAPLDPLLYGLEDENLYIKNAAAVRKALHQKPQGSAFLSASWTILGETVSNRFSPEAADLFKKTKDYWAGLRRLGDYIEALGSAAPEAWARHPQVSRYRKASVMERAMDLDGANRERHRLLAVLVERAPQEDLKGLVEKSLSLRMGQITQTAYYDALETVLGKAGLRKESYPTFAHYIDYVRESDAIDPPTLLIELKRLEKDVWARLAKTAEEKQVIEAASDLQLMEKLINLNLTSEEWAAYLTRREQIQALPGLVKQWHAHPQPSGRLSGKNEGFIKKLSTPLSSAKMGLPPAPSLAIFESFYALAEMRSREMAARLATAAQEEQRDKGKKPPQSPPVIVLVAGGFHADRMEKMLLARGMTCITAAPKLMDAGTVKENDYLSVFAVGKTPLDRLFESPRVTLVNTLAMQPIGKGTRSQARGQALEPLTKELQDLLSVQTGEGKKTESLGQRPAEVEQGDGWIAARYNDPSPRATVVENSGHHAGDGAAKLTKGMTPLLKGSTKGRRTITVHGFDKASQMTQEDLDRYGDWRFTDLIEEQIRFWLPISLPLILALGMLSAFTILGPPITGLREVVVSIGFLLSLSLLVDSRRMRQFVDSHARRFELLSSRERSQYENYLRGRFLAFGFLTLAGTVFWFYGLETLLANENLWRRLAGAVTQWGLAVFLGQSSNLLPHGINDKWFKWRNWLPASSGELKDPLEDLTEISPTESQTEFVKNIIQPVSGLDPQAHGVQVAYAKNRAGELVIVLRHQKKFKGKNFDFSYRIEFNRSDVLTPRRPKLGRVNVIHVPPNWNAINGDLGGLIRAEAENAWRRSTILDPLLYKRHRREGVEEAPYQRRAIDLAKAALEKNQKAFVILPTGAGKTLVTLKTMIERRLEKGHKGAILFLVNNLDILKQIKESLALYFPDKTFSIGFAQSGVFDVENKDIILATPSFLIGKNGDYLKAEGDESDPETASGSDEEALYAYDRLQALFSKTEISGVIIDESHHLPANTQAGIFRQIEAASRDKGWKTEFLGCTATPSRPDLKTPVTFFGEVTYEYTYTEAVGEGYLAQPEVVAGDKGFVEYLKEFHQHLYEQVVDRPALLNRIEPGTELDDAYKDYMYHPSRYPELYDSISANTEYQPYQKTLVVAKSKMHAQLLAGYLREGCKLHGKKPLKNVAVLTSNERGPEFDQKYFAWKHGRWPTKADGAEFPEASPFANEPVPEIVIGVDIFNEGVDVPDINRLVLWADTNSIIKFMQRVGRALRPAPFKEALIVDAVGLHRRKVLFFHYLIENFSSGLRDSKQGKGGRKKGEGAGEFDELDLPEGVLAELGEAEEGRTLGEQAMELAFPGLEGDADVTSVFTAFFEDIPGYFSRRFPGGYAELLKYPMDLRRLDRYLAKKLDATGPDATQQLKEKVQAVLSTLPPNAKPGDLALAREALGPAFVIPGVYEPNQFSERVDVCAPTRFVFERLKELAGDSGDLHKVFSEFTPVDTSVRRSNNLGSLRKILFGLTPEKMASELQQSVGTPLTDNIDNAFIKQVESGTGFKRKNEKEAAAGRQTDLMTAYLAHPTVQALEPTLSVEDFDSPEERFENFLRKRAVIVTKSQIQLFWREFQSAIVEHFDKNLEEITDLKAVRTLTDFYRTAAQIPDLENRRIAAHRFDELSGPSKTLLEKLPQQIQNSEGKNRRAAESLLNALHELLEYTGHRVQFPVSGLPEVMVVVDRFEGQSNYTFSLQSRDSALSEALKNPGIPVRVYSDFTGQPFARVVNYWAADDVNLYTQWHALHEQLSNNNGVPHLVDAFIQALEYLEGLYNHNGTRLVMIMPKESSGRSFHNEVLQKLTERTDPRVQVLGPVEKVPFQHSGDRTTYMQYTRDLLPTTHLPFVDSNWVNKSKEGGLRRGGKKKVQIAILLHLIAAWYYFKNIFPNQMKEISQKYGLPLPSGIGIQPSNTPSTIHSDGLLRKWGQFTRFLNYYIAKDSEVWKRNERTKLVLDVFLADIGDINLEGKIEMATMLLFLNLFRKSGSFHAMMTFYLRAARHAARCSLPMPTEITEEVHKQVHQLFEDIDTEKLLDEYGESIATWTGIDDFNFTTQDPLTQNRRDEAFGLYGQIQELDRNLQDLMAAPKNLDNYPGRLEQFLDHWKIDRALPSNSLLQPRPNSQETNIILLENELPADEIQMDAGKKSEEEPRPTDPPEQRAGPPYYNEMGRVVLFVAVPKRKGKPPHRHINPDCPLLREAAAKANTDLKIMDSDLVRVKDSSKLFCHACKTPPNADYFNELTKAPTKTPLPDRFVNLPEYFPSFNLRHNTRAQILWLAAAFVMLGAAVFILPLWIADSSSLSGYIMAPAALLSGSFSLYSSHFLRSQGRSVRSSKHLFDPDLMTELLAELRAFEPDIRAKLREAGWDMDKISSLEIEAELTGGAEAQMPIQGNLKLSAWLALMVLMDSQERFDAWRDRLRQPIPYEEFQGLRTASINAVFYNESTRLKMNLWIESTIPFLFSSGFSLSIYILLQTVFIYLSKPLLHLVRQGLHRTVRNAPDTREIPLEPFNQEEVQIMLETFRRLFDSDSALNDSDKVFALRILTVADPLRKERLNPIDSKWLSSQLQKLEERGDPAPPSLNRPAEPGYQPDSLIAEKILFQLNQMARTHRQGIAPTGELNNLGRLLGMVASQKTAKNLVTAFSDFYGLTDDRSVLDKEISVGAALRLAQYNRSTQFVDAALAEAPLNSAENRPGRDLPAKGNWTVIQVDPLTMPRRRIDRVEVLTEHLIHRARLFKMKKGKTDGLAFVQNDVLLVHRLINGSEAEVRRRVGNVLVQGGIELADARDYVANCRFLNFQRELSPDLVLVEVERLDSSKTKSKRLMRFLTAQSDDWRISRSALLAQKESQRWQLFQLLPGLKVQSVLERITELNKAAAVVRTAA